MITRGPPNRNSPGRPAGHPGGDPIRLARPGAGALAAPAGRVGHVHPGDDPARPGRGQQQGRPAAGRPRGPPPALGAAVDLRRPGGAERPPAHGADGGGPRAPAPARAAGAHRPALGPPPARVPPPPLGADPALGVAVGLGGARRHERGPAARALDAGGPALGPGGRTAPGAAVAGVPARGVEGRPARTATTCDPSHFSCGVLRLLHALVYDAAPHTAQPVRPLPNGTFCRPVPDVPRQYQGMLG